MDAVTATLNNTFSSIASKGAVAELAPVVQEITSSPLFVPGAAALGVTLFFKWMFAVPSELAHLPRVSIQRYIAVFMPFTILYLGACAPHVALLCQG
jgi:hypothetical protein